jgi:Terminase large subunit, T4likevirus-type, N-terminal
MSPEGLVSQFDPSRQTIIWSPQPGPQTALLMCPVFEVFYGGARGGGKTESSIGDWLQHSNLHGEGAIGIFFRRSLNQLGEVIARTKQLFPKIGAAYNEKKSTWTMANGARLKFAYLDRDQDAENYQGHNYTRIYIEELTNFPSPAPVNMLRAALRSGSGVPTAMRFTGNPGGPGHNWVKARYIDPAPLGYKIITEEDEVELDGVVHKVSLDRVFIPSKLSDNSLLIKNDPTYILKLKQSGSDALVEAWLKGDWNAVDGAFFSEWSDKKHVLREEDVLDLIPASDIRFRAFDWGQSSPFCVGWYVHLSQELKTRCGRILPKGAIIKYAEWYGAELTQSGVRKGLKIGADLIAKGIVEREKSMPKVWYGVADPSIRNHFGGPSILEIMSVHGCAWNLGDNNRKAGHNQIRQRLVGDGVSPMFYALDCCKDTIRTISTQQHEKENSEDLDTDGEDHAVDETRYGLMSRPWFPNGVKLGDIMRNPIDMTINEIIAHQSRLRKEQA